MALIVQKFGGTSVANFECIQRVAEIVQKTRVAGHDVVVIVSAMHGETDRLIQLASNFSAKNTSREYDALVSTGEQVSAAVLSIALIEKGCKSRSLSAGNIPITTDADHKNAKILSVDQTRLYEHIANGEVAVIAGFQGINVNGDITTFGRGGSDISAVAIAAALEAAECQIYTDVDGVFTTDPRVVHNARRLDRITYEEMLEFSSLGAKVLQIRAVEFARKYKVPLRVLSSFQPGPGTSIVDEEGSMEQPVVSGIAFDRNQAKLTITQIPKHNSLAACVLSAVGDANIDVDMIVQTTSPDSELSDFTFTVSRDDYPEAMIIAEQLSQTLSAKGVLGNDKIAKLSVVGVGMRRHSGVASTMFRALSDEEIQPQLISTSEIKISVLIDEKYIELGARVLHAAFDLHEQSDTMLQEGVQPPAGDRSTDTPTN